MSTVNKTQSKASTIEASLDGEIISLQPTRPRFQNFFLIWLDVRLNGSNEDFKQYLEHLHNTIGPVTTFTNAGECVDLLSEIREEKAFIIMSHSLGQRLIFDIEINTWPQLNYIYILCDKYLTPEDLAKYTLKVKSVHTSMEPIIQELEADTQKHDRDTIPMSFSGIDPLFMYTQLLKEAFLEIEDDDEKSIREFVEYFRHQDVSKLTIEKFEREYRDHGPIWWYTGPFFIFGSLNYGLRVMDTDIIFKMGFFIRHLHNHIQKLYVEQQSNSLKRKNPFTVYRGQGLSLENFDKMKQTKGGLMSFNNFLSTSLNRQVSLEFAQTFATRTDLVGILFVIIVDSQICSESAVPFAEVKDVSYYKEIEAEILFTTHTIFRIEKYQCLQDKHDDRIWEVYLTLVGNDDHELNNLVFSLRNDITRAKGWSRLGYLLIKLGEPTKAENLYKILLENAPTDGHRAEYNNLLGWLYHDLGEQKRAITYFETALDFQTKSVPLNNIDLADSYNNIGLVYYKMGEYSKAISSHERSLEIKNIGLPPNHPDLAASYNNIGMVYSNMGEYSKALSSYERSFEIQKTALPPNHPLLAASYNNTGLVYDKMGEYLKALSSYQRSLEIRKIALPPNHPDLAASYNNIGMVYSNMGEYSKAISSHERSLEIGKIALPPNHPDLAASYNNIGLVYYNMGEYSKAISSHEQSLKIGKISLPPNHPLLAASYNNIGMVYYNMGEYSKALSSYERSLEIRKIALPPNHSDLATSYNNIGMVYYNMGEHSKAISSHERSLEIKNIALPPNHPLLAASYNNIGMVYHKMGEYSKALSSYERSLEIGKISLPSNHPLLAASYNNIGVVYSNMDECSKAIASCEQSLQIQKIALPSNHPDLATSYISIGSVYHNIGEYSRALSFYEKAQNILTTSLPPTHPHIVLLKRLVKNVQQRLN